MTSSYSSGILTLNADTPTKGTVGLGNVDNIQQYSATNPPPYPVTSVNGSTGDVTINIPSNVSDLTNDSGYITGITSFDITTALGYTPSNVNLLNNYRTTTEQNEIDDAQDERLDAVEQTTTATTVGQASIATFDASAADMPLKGLTVNIEPVQAGEGDPSPENVRPITGWTGATVNVSPTTDAQDGNTYPITFPAEAGTVYGGTLDVVNKRLTIDSVGVKIKDITWIYDSKYTRFQSSPPLPYAAKPAPSQYAIPDGLMCECYQIYQANSLPDKNIAITNTGKILLNDVNYTTQEDLKAAVGEYLIVYTIATPIVYDLADASNVLTIGGTNNIWADCGDVTVTYGAYLETVKSYADKVGDSILSAIAPLETTYTASRAYTVGSFLFVGTKFYKVTASIASGDTINPGTNVTQTTVAEQLMALAANA